MPPPSLSPERAKVAKFYSARSKTIPPLPWQTFALPFSKPLRQEVLLQAIREHSVNAVLVPGTVKTAPGRSGFSSDRIAQRSALYLVNCSENAAKMLVALDQSDIETVATLGHNLRGSGGSFGFPPISEIGTVIQNAAEAGNYGEARTAVLALRVILDAVQPDGA